MRVAQGPCGPESRGPDRNLHDSPRARARVYTPRLVGARRSQINKVRARARGRGREDIGTPRRRLKKCRFFAREFACCVYKCVYEYETTVAKIYNCEEGCERERETTEIGFLTPSLCLNSFACGL